MPDILLEIAPHLYFYMRDDGKIGLADKTGSDTVYHSFELDQLTKVIILARERIDEKEAIKNIPHRTPRYKEGPSYVNIPADRAWERTENHPTLPSIDQYTYKVTWSTEDKAYIAKVLEFESLATHGNSAEEAIMQLHLLVRTIIDDMRKNGEDIPEPQNKTTPEQAKNIPKKRLWELYQSAMNQSVKLQKENQLLVQRVIDALRGIEQGNEKIPS